MECYWIDENGEYMGAGNEERAFAGVVILFHPAEPDAFGGGESDRIVLRHLLFAIIEYGRAHENSPTPDALIGDIPVPVSDLATHLDDIGAFAYAVLVARKKRRRSVARLARYPVAIEWRVEHKGFFAAYEKALREKLIALADGILEPDEEVSGGNLPIASFRGLYALCDEFIRNELYPDRAHLH